ncbi:hypothetical protein BJV74DRAFT_615072 [Russula compacta]|nr:hypothetical protein BJV74DRAFT_615072 [Russula compacta]
MVTVEVFKHAQGQRSCSRHYGVQLQLATTGASSSATQARIDQDQRSMLGCLGKVVPQLFCNPCLISLFQAKPLGACKTQIGQASLSAGGSGSPIPQVVEGRRFLNAHTTHPTSSQPSWDSRLGVSIRGQYSPGFAPRRIPGCRQTSCLFVPPQWATMGETRKKACCPCIRETSFKTCAALFITTMWRHPMRLVSVLRDRCDLMLGLPYVKGPRVGL